jgi:lysozyme
MTGPDLAVLRDQLTRHEGLRLKPYRCTAGKLTIGVGRNIEDRGISPDEAAILLDNDISDSIRALSRALPWFDALDAVRQRALVDMSFMGVGKLLEFRRMLAALGRQDYATAAKEALDSKWAQDVGPARSRAVARMLETGTEG